MWGENLLDRIRNTQGNIDFSYIDFTVHKSIEEMVTHSTEDTVHNTLEYCMCNGIDFTKMTWDEVQNLENTNSQLTESITKFEKLDEDTRKT